MKTVISLLNQTIFDLAAQHYGSTAQFEKIFELNPGLQNDYSYALTLGIPVDVEVFDFSYPIMQGSEIKIDESLIDRSVVRELAGKDVVSFEKKDLDAIA